MEEEITPEPVACQNPVIDAVRSMFSAVGKDITCDKSKGIVMMVGLAIVGIIILKFFVLKK